MVLQVSGLLHASEADEAAKAEELFSSAHPNAEEADFLFGEHASALRDEAVERHLRYRFVVPQVKTHVRFVRGMVQGVDLIRRKRSQNETLGSEHGLVARGYFAAHRLPPYGYRGTPRSLAFYRSTTRAALIGIPVNKPLDAPTSLSTSRCPPPSAPRGQPHRSR